MQQRTIESIDNSDQTDLISHAGLVTRCSEKKERGTNPRNKESSSIIFERNEEKKRFRGNWRRKYIVRKNCVSTEQLKNRTFDALLTDIKQLIFTCQSKIKSSFYFLIYGKKFFSEIENCIETIRRKDLMYLLSKRVSVENE